MQRMPDRKAEIRYSYDLEKGEAFVIIQVLYVELLQATHIRLRKEFDPDEEIETPGGLALYRKRFAMLSFVQLHAECVRTAEILRDGGYKTDVKKVRAPHLHVVDLIA